MAKNGKIVIRVFKRLFKPRSIPRPLLIGMPFLVAIIIALFSQYVVFLPLKGSSAVPGLIATGLIIGTLFTYKFRAKKIRGISLGAAIVIGFLLVPYFAFFIGKIHLFAVDRMPEGFTVIEMRITMEKVNFVDTHNNEVTAWSGPITFTLRPGVTRVYLGTFEFPAGTYVTRRVYMGNVEIDAEVDISEMKDNENQPISTDDYQTVYADIQADFNSENGHFQTMFPNGGGSNWSALDGSKFTFTMSTGAWSENEPIVPSMDYPGFGGPDITLDFTLDNSGVVTVTPIMDMPPGFEGAAGGHGGPPT